MILEFVGIFLIVINITCILATCGGDPNAVPGCGINCGKHCSNIGQGPVACPAICKVNGCDCKKGYYFNDNIQKCVKPEECSKCS